jgi:ribosomal protein S18 acetylase RimI-like enzyme
MGINRTHCVVPFVPIATTMPSMSLLYCCFVQPVRPRVSVSPALSPLLLSHSLQTGTTRTTYHPPRTTHYSHSLVLGKVEGKGDNWHGHVTAVTIAPEYRRLGLAKRLMDSLEHVSENM